MPGLGDAFGYFDAALDEAYGLVNSEELRSCLLQTKVPLVVLVSANILGRDHAAQVRGIDQTADERLSVGLKSAAP
ncbi:MAG TPA: hypothetical protein VIV12_28830 [Streptosporangiaceae bacterium]